MACQTFIITFEPEQQVRLTDIIKQWKRSLEETNMPALCLLGKTGCIWQLKGSALPWWPPSSDRSVIALMLVWGRCKNMISETPIKPLLCVHILLKMIFISPFFPLLGPSPQIYTVLNLRMKLLNFPFFVALSYEYNLQLGCLWWKILTSSIKLILRILCLLL